MTIDEKALEHDEARRYGVIEDALARLVPTLPPMHRRGAAQALLRGETKINVVVDGVGNTTEFSLVGVAEDLHMRVAPDPDEHAASARALNDLQHERRMRDEKSEQATRLWTHMQTIADRTKRKIEDQPELWPHLAAYTNLRLELAMHDVILGIAEKIKVSPTWLTGLPALLANGPRAPEVPSVAEQLASFDPTTLPPPPAPGDTCASSDDIIVGSVVTLRSGGPAMTVETVDGVKVACIWFVDSDHGWCGPMRGEFPLDLVRRH